MRRTLLAMFGVMAILVAMGASVASAVDAKVTLGETSVVVARWEGELEIGGSGSGRGA